MCLKLSYKQRKARIPLVANEDIVVYKILKYNRNIPNVLMTPYRDYVITVGSVYSSIFSFDEDGDVERGLHSFKSLKTAIRESFGYYAFPRVVCKCTIPKGSKYYQGKFENSVSFASDTLVYNEILDI